MGSSACRDARVQSQARRSQRTMRERTADSHLPGYSLALGGWGGNGQVERYLPCRLPTFCHLESHRVSRMLVSCALEDFGRHTKEDCGGREHTRLHPCVSGCPCAHAHKTHACSAHAGGFRVARKGPTEEAHRIPGGRIPGGTEGAHRQLTRDSVLARKPFPSLDLNEAGGNGCCALVLSGIQ